MFQIPLYMIRDLTVDRRSHAAEVEKEIGASWGGKQEIQLIHQADREDVAAEITPEIRYRGIYETTVYTAKVKIKADYVDVPANTTTGVKVSDLKAVTGASAMVNGKEVPINDQLEFDIPKGNSNCEITLTLRGSSNLQLKPNAANSHMTISGTWDDPGFFGEILPEKRSVKDGKFSAEWNLSKFNKNVDHVGVDLCISAGTYQQVERCFRYATFFLIVFFFALLAAELLTKVFVHVLQYLVAAGAPVLFYLMTLAFAEKIGFTAGYIVSAVIIVAMVTMYARMFIGKLKPALIMGSIFAASYVVNFVILRMEDLALLTGTIILAVVLGVLMVLTGNINREPKDDQDKSKKDDQKDDQNKSKKDDQ